MAFVVCDYCGHPAKKVTGKTLYPHRPDLASLVAYECRPCDARVGCHPGTDRPLGRLANAPLRKIRQEAHAAFDPIWKGGKKRRTQAYQWLAARLNIPDRDCHIGMMDEETCRRVIEICAPV